MRQSFSLAWNRFWFRTSPGHVEGLFRIAICTILLLDVLGLLGELDLFYSSQGLYPDTPIDVLYESTTVGLFYWMWVVTLLILLLGYRTTLAASLNFFFLLYFFSFRGGVYTHAIEWVFVPMCFYLIWMKSGRVFSLDSIRNLQKHEATVWPVRLAQLHIAVTYFLSGISKTQDELWSNGTAMYKAWSNPFIAYENVVAFLPSSERLLMVLTYSIIVWQLVVPFALFYKRTKVAAITSAIFFHLLILLTMRVGWFSELMIASFVVFLIDLDVEHSKEESTVPKKSFTLHAFLLFQLFLFASVTVIYSFPENKVGEEIHKAIKRAPLLDMYTYRVLNIRSFNVYPTVLFLGGPGFHLYEAEYPDGTVRVLPPFTEERIFRSGFGHASDARLGLFILKIIYGEISEENWKIYLTYIVENYGLHPRYGCPEELRVYIHESSLRSQKEFTDTLLVRAGILCGENTQIRTLHFTKRGERSLKAEEK